MIQLSVIHNFLNIHSPQLNIPSFPTLTTNYIESGQNWICSNTLLSYPVLKGPRKIFWKPSGSLPYAYPVQLTNNIALFALHGAIAPLSVFTFDPPTPTQNSLHTRTHARTHTHTHTVLQVSRTKTPSCTKMLWWSVRNVTHNKNYVINNENIVTKFFKYHAGNDDIRKSNFSGLQ